jgi:hypothetical protein
MRNGNAATVQDGTLPNDAAESLPARMGVTLTAAGRRTLTTGRYMSARVLPLRRAARRWKPSSTTARP